MNIRFEYYEPTDTIYYWIDGEKYRAEGINSKESVEILLNALSEVNQKLIEENESLKREVRFLQSELHDCSFKSRAMILREVKEEIEKLERYC